MSADLGINDLVAKFKKKNPEYDISPQQLSAPVPQNGPLYAEDDYVVILDDSSFIGRKIKSKNFQGPGILKAYAPWCPHCRNKATAIRLLAEILDDAEAESAVYVLNVTDNVYISKTLEVVALPTFFEVDKNGVIKGPLENITSIDDLRKYLH